METDFRVHVGVFTNPKILKLNRRLGGEQFGLVPLLKLWGFTRTHRPSGVLHGMSVEDIAIAAGWPLDRAASEFVDALCDLRLLDQFDDVPTWEIHDWRDANPYAVAAPARSIQQRLRVHRGRYCPVAKPKPENAGQRCNERECEHFGRAFGDSPTDTSATSTGGNDSSTSGNTGGSVPSTPVPVPVPVPVPRTKGSLSVSSETDHRSHSLRSEKAPEIPSDLAAAMDFWNGTIAPAWGKPTVKRSTVVELAKKYGAIAAHMLEYDGWSMEASLRRAHEKNAGLAAESWFRFKPFLFEHDYLQKNEKLWTGFYDSMYGAASPALSLSASRRPEGRAGAVT